MSDNTAEEAKDKKTFKKRKTGYGGWLFRKKGATDSWPAVRKEMQKVRNAFKNYKVKEDQK